MERLTRLRVSPKTARKMKLEETGPWRLDGHRFDRKAEYIRYLQLNAAGAQIHDVHTSYPLHWPGGRHIVTFRVSFEYTLNGREIIEYCGPRDPHTKLCITLMELARAIKVEWVVV